MRSTSDLRKIWGPDCSRQLRVVTLHSGARLSVNLEAAEAFKALDAVMQAFGYSPRPGDSGAYNCRTITGGSGFSLHAFGVAADINWNSNPFRKDNKLVTDMPPEMVAAIKAIKTTGGARVFRWGGDYRRVKDAMHFEVVASRREMGDGIDWATVRAEPPDPAAPTSWPTVERGDKGSAVEELQQRLVAAGFVLDVDGSFGSETESTVLNYQASRSLDSDGIVGLQTWTALLSDQPEVEGADSPVKADVRPPDSHPSTRPTLKLGSEGLDVVDVQRRLIGLGFKPGADDAVFGPKTEAGVKGYQKSRTLEIDGIVGLRTWEALLTST